MNTYHVSTDVTAGEVNLELLREQIANSGFVADFNGVTYSNDILEVIGEVTNQSGLDALMLNHITYCLAHAKASKISAIDARTREIISNGFAFDGQQFSLSTQAQTNWLGLVSLQSLFTWPVSITTNADTSYALSQANVVAFVATGCGSIANAIGTGRALKIAVNACSTKEELDLVIDTR